MQNNKIDFTRYTLEELLDCRDKIDAAEYPVRASEIDLLIKDRSRQEVVSETHQEYAKEDRENTLKKPQFLPTLGKGISEIIGSAFIYLVYKEKFQIFENSSENLNLFLLFIIASGSISGIFKIYKAFSIKQSYRQIDNKKVNLPYRASDEDNGGAVRRN